MRVNKNTTFLPLWIKKKKKNHTRFSLLQKKKEKAPLLLLRKAHQSFFTKTTFGMCYTSPTAKGRGCLTKALSHGSNSLHRAAAIPDPSHTALQTCSIPGSVPAQGLLSRDPPTRTAGKPLAKGRSSLCTAEEPWGKLAGPGTTSGLALPASRSAHPRRCPREHLEVALSARAQLGLVDPKNLFQPKIFFWEVAAPCSFPAPFSCPIPSSHSQGGIAQWGVSVSIWLSEGLGHTLNTPSPPRLMQTSSRAVPSWEAESRRLFVLPVEGLHWDVRSPGKQDTRV